jgi:hypothetical protein
MLKEINKDNFIQMKGVEFASSYSNGKPAPHCAIVAIDPKIGITIKDLDDPDDSQMGYIYCYNGKSFIDEGTKNEEEVFDDIIKRLSIINDMVNESGVVSFDTVFERCNTQSGSFSTPCPFV